MKKLILTLAILCSVTFMAAAQFTLTFFIEGYYRGNSTMVATLYNLQLSPNPTDVDYVTIELHNNDATYSLAASYPNIILQTDGTCTFNPAVTGSYYIVIKHRNAV